MVHINDLAKKIGKSIRTLQHWVSTGLANPSNMDTHRRDGGYVFTKEEARRLMALFNGIGLNDAANLVGVTPQHLNELALAGKIESELRQIGSQKRRFFKRNDCLLLRDYLRAGQNKRSSRFGRKLDPYAGGSRLFGFLDYKEKKCLVVNTRPPLQLLCEDGTTLQSNEPQVMEPWPEKKYQVKKGFIEFRFPIPRIMEHPVYELLPSLLGSLGVKNVQVFETKQADYYVRCRSGRLPFSEEAFSMLKQFVISGQVIQKDDIIILESDTASRYVHFEKPAYELVLRTMQIENMSFDEAVNWLINQKMKDV